MKLSKTALCLLILISLIGSGLGAPTAKITCDTNEVQVNVDGGSLQSGEKYCLIKSQIIYHCQVYKTDGNCYQCPQGSSVQSLDESYMLIEIVYQRYACIPYSQQMVNCQHYKYSPNCVIQFECISCPIDSILQFKIVQIVDNVNGITKACASTLIPGCIEYYQGAIMYPFSPIYCKTCDTGYEQGLGYINLFKEEQKKKICIQPGSIQICTNLTVANDRFECQNDNACTYPLYFKTGPVLLTCVSQEYFNTIQSACYVYDKYESDPSALKCVECPLMFKMFQNYQIQYGTFKTSCEAMSLAEQGCKTYIYNQNNIMLCTQCISTTQYDFIPLDPSYQPQWLTLLVGTCVAKNRFNLQTSRCASYASIDSYDSSLICATCVDKSLTSPCYPQAQNCQLQQVQVTMSDNLPGCLYYRNLIDYCEIYDRTTTLLGLYRCFKCQQGYLLVQAQTTFSQVKSICIKPLESIQNCDIYDHENLKKCLKYVQPTSLCQSLVNTDVNCIEVLESDFTKCKTCSQGWKSSVDQLTCLVKGPNDYILHCQVLVSGDNTKCETCKYGYKTDNDQHSCIDKSASEMIQLCQQATIDYTLETSVCQSCQFGYKTNIEKTICVEKSAGQMITNCVSMTIDYQAKTVSCITCVFGFTSDDNGLTCRQKRADQFITFCSQVSIDWENEIVTCQQCSGGKVPSNDNKECHDPAPVIPHCILTKTQEPTKCQTCETDFKPSETGLQCLEKVVSDYIAHCTAFVGTDKTKCQACETGWKTNDLNTECILIQISHCKTYNIDNHSKCDECDLGWVPNLDYSLCFYDISLNCENILASSVTTQPICKSCKIGYTLSNVAISASLSLNLCIPTLVSIPHCSSLQYIKASGLYTCLNCKSSYEKIDIVVNGESIKKCISEWDFVDRCENYGQSLNTCTYKCLKCQDGFQLVGVQTQTGRVQQECINKDTEFLPSCDVYLQIFGKYYCKHGHCASSSSQIKIGSEPKNLACTTFALFTGSNACLIYQRPSKNDTELKCSVCNDGTLLSPYCTNA